MICIYVLLVCRCVVVRVPPQKTWYESFTNLINQKICAVCLGKMKMWLPALLHFQHHPLVFASYSKQDLAIPFALSKDISFCVLNHWKLHFMYKNSFKWQCPLQETLMNSACTTEITFCAQCYYIQFHSWFSGILSGCTSMLREIFIPLLMT